MKNNTISLTKDLQKKIRDYFDYEGKIYYSKQELIAAVAHLNISVSIRNLLRTRLIRSTYKDRIYQVLEGKSSITGLLTVLFDSKELFYLGGIYAFNTQGLINQLPVSYQVINTKITGQKKLGVFNVIFQRKSPKFFYGINSRTYLPELERTLLDYCYTFGYKRFKSAFDSQKGTVDFQKLADYAMKYPIQSIGRRVLYTLDEEGLVANNIQEKMTFKSLITLYNDRPRRGKIDRKWNLIINK
ncbi:MAG: hypothetical protein HRT90_07710 [Candidatus Margulisbacteria bacterium]|nr:hypothetical protein [Candidatus Margulisiibacteriota bacterium]